MAAKHSSRRYANLVAAFAASAFALVVTASVTHVRSDAEVASLLHRAPTVSNGYQYRRLFLCGSNVRNGSQRVARRACNYTR